MKVSSVRAPKGTLKWNIGDHVWKVERYWNEGKFIFPLWNILFAAIPCFLSRKESLISQWKSPG